AYGLSEYGLTALTRNLYSEFDFTRTILQGETLGLSQQGFYNDFMLSREAIGVMYDMMLQDIVSHRLPADVMFSQIPEERLAHLDLSYAELNAHDTQVMDVLAYQTEHFDFDGVKALYATETSSYQENDFFDDMFV